MLNINPKEMLYAFPAGVMECQCPCYTASSLERLCVCSQTHCFWFPPSSYSSVSPKNRKRKGKGKKKPWSFFIGREKPWAFFFLLVRNPILVWDLANALQDTNNFCQKQFLKKEGNYNIRSLWIRYDCQKCPYRYIYIYTFSKTLYESERYKLDI